MPFTEDPGVGGFSSRAVEVQVRFEFQENSSLGTT